MSVLLSISPQEMREKFFDLETARDVADLLEIKYSDLVFSHYDGTPLLPNTITHAWIKLTRKCGLPGVRLHDARHTHASLLLKQGVHPKIVQERLGHGSIQITLDTYSHIVPSMQQAAAAKFDDIVLPQRKETIENKLL